jgi:TrmH family RNA methyltransferase
VDVTDITSTRNEHVRALAGLLRARDRRATGRHLVEGPHAVAEALRSRVVDEVLGTEEALTALRAELEPLDPTAASTARWTSVSPHVAERLCDTSTPQGVVAVATTPVVDLAAIVPGPLLVVLHAVGDPGNVGTIIRTADAVGASGVVVGRGSADPYAPRSLRAAAGSTYHLPIVTGVATVDVVGTLRAAGHRVVGLDGGASVLVDELTAGAAGIALVLGNEAHGLDPELVAALEGTVAVPIHGRAESLNVAAAAAVALYTVRAVADAAAPGSPED